MADVAVDVTTAGELFCLVTTAVVVAVVTVVAAVDRLLMNMSACLTLSLSQVLLRSLVASASGMATPLCLLVLAAPSLSITA